MPNLFVYGTLRKDCNTLINSRFLGGSKFIGYAKTNGILLDFEKYPGMIKGKGEVFGEMWLTDENSLEQMDLYEGQMFVREKIIAFMDEQEISCYTYFFKAKIIESGNFC